MSAPPRAYRLLDAPLGALLERSFDDRALGLPDAELNLANAWWSPGHDGPPATAWEAIARIGPAGSNVITRIHERVRALDPSLELWRAIRYIRNVWWGGSAGFKVVWDDPDAAREALDTLFPRVARDGFLGGLEHQLGSPLAVLAARPLARWRDHADDLPDSTTFREVSALGAEAVHFCVGRRAPRPPALDDVHLDWRSPVRALDPITRRCAYAVCEGARHWLQATRGLGAPRVVFEVMDDLVAAVAARGGVTPRAAWDDLAARWREARWELALGGADGHARAAAYRWEAEDLLASVVGSSSAR